MKIDSNFWKKATSLAVVSCGGFTLFAGFSVYKNNDKFYDNFLMRLINTLNPETSHEIAVAVSKYNLLPRSSFKDPDILKNEVWNLKFSNPVGIAAGFDKHCEAVESLHKIGFGFVEIGSVTPLPQPGNEKPRVFRLAADDAIINRYGFNSEGHEAVFERIKALKDKKNFQGIIGVNLGKNRLSEEPVQDYLSGIKKFGEVADYLVINISSPNTPGLRQWQKKQQLEELLSALLSARNKLDKKPPLLLKLAPDLTESEREDIARVITNEKVDGLVISNTTVYRPGLTSPSGKEEGGLSGRPLKSLSTELIADMYRLTDGKIPIIGVGGIFSGQDALEKIQAGACLIQLYTAFAYHGPPRVARVKRELSELLRNSGYNSVAEAIGTSLKTNDKTFQR